MKGWFFLFVVLAVGYVAGAKWPSLAAKVGIL
jgi:hypothetical protein